jgi:hypothetical protein
MRDWLTVKKQPTTQRGRPGILPPLGVDFETALGALLKTPPPGDKSTRKVSKRKQKGGK